VVSGNRKVLGTIRKDDTVVVINTAEVMPGDFERHREYQLPTDKLTAALTKAAGRKHLHFIEAARAAEAIFANTIAANMFMLGFAAQKGGLPVSPEAVEEAIRLNGQAVTMNTEAFRWGRRAAHDPAAIEELLAAKRGRSGREPARTLDEVIDRRAEFLTGYQDAAYAQRYRDRIAAVAARERAIAGEAGALTETAARQLFKLMAVKDEFEVARLYTQPEFRRQMASEFSSWRKIEFHLAPPILGKTDSRGGPKKTVFGPWMMKAFAVLAPMKRLRFSPLNIFARHPDRKLEWETLAEYERDLDRIAALADEVNLAGVIELAAWPEDIAGYGHVRAKSIEAAMTRRAEHNRAMKAKI
jgi:indolepyruvate ferredoxin oxidoreductase